MASINKRLNALERSTIVEKTIVLCWAPYGLILDEDSGEEITIEEWANRHPDNRLVVLCWGDVKESIG